MLRLVAHHPGITSQVERVRVTNMLPEMLIFLGKTLAQSRLLFDNMKERCKDFKNALRVCRNRGKA